jgi:hypothetical protein
MIQQDKSATDSMTGQQITALVLLESPRSTTDQETCRLLSEVKFLTDPTNFLSVSISNIYLAIKPITAYSNLSV